MSRQAIVGAFTLLGIVALFGVYFVISSFSTRVSGYQIGVHFDSAGGLTSGALVYESGLKIGTVSQIRMLSDFTVDVVMQIAKDADVPRDSQFAIESTLTGTASVDVKPPRGRAKQVVMLPRYILPIDQQPHGENPAQIQDLLQTGSTTLAKVNALLSDLGQREPQLMGELEAAIKNANTLTLNANGMLRDFSKRGTELTSTLQRTLDSASANIVDLTGRLDDTIRRNGGRIDTLLGSLDRTATSLESATKQLQSLASNPQLRGDALDTMHQIAVTMNNMAALSADLRGTAENPVTQGQLRDTLAHIDAVSQRASSLLGSLGGTSSVYGVDAGATPPPGNSPSGRILPAGAAPAVPSPAPAASGSPSEGQKKGAMQLSPAIRDRIGDLAKNLIEIQIRLDELSVKSATLPNTALLNADRGPQSDFNVVVLPHAQSQLYAGVNDISANQTWNFALRQRLSSDLAVGGGILYSRLGVMGLVTKGVFGFEGLAYDPRYGYVDGYLRLRATPNIDLFAGERDILHDTRRTTYGLRYRFLGGL